ncbi:MAG: flagellar hook protein FlgE [Pseudomonadota bacterium]|jgi:flagellar hook protein FlgE|nr:flagellar hook protein FlgE [Pseudomonadota bacterium]QKK05309.1 MAG: flagellar hook protein FlgE [Pseudomonadota bacterium]
MSIFGSLFTAVSGLAAQGQSISMISNNIANVSTTGYKRTDALFSSLVTTTGRSTAYTPGSVRAVQTARVDQQGILQQSNSTTDVAISGNGFFVVQDSLAATGETLFTRAGSFSEDENGILQNSSGFFLMGWPLDQNGALPAGQANITSLVPVDVASVGSVANPTTQAALGVNLDATETQSAYPVAPGFTPDFSRSIRVFDSLGTPQDLVINMQKHITPTANVTGTVDLTAIAGDLSNDPNILATDQFDITVGATGPVTITLDGNLAKLLSDINSITDVGGNPVAFATLDANGQLQIKARNIGDTLTLAEGAGTPLTDGLGLAGAIGATAAPAAPTALAATATTPNTEGWWHVEIQTPGGLTLTSGSINFDGAGQLNATPDANGEVLLSMTGIDFGNGSALQDIDLDIATMTQFSSPYDVRFAQQNGSELGLRSGVSIDDEGIVSIQFSNGQSRQVYKLPLATFPNPNGLQEVTGTAFRESDISGGFNLREAGTGGAGDVEGGALEASNVDIAEEFSKMIVTQRAYSANTRVISTTDQMTEELLRLR